MSNDKWDDNQIGTLLTLDAELLDGSPDLWDDQDYEEILGSCRYYRRFRS